MPKLTILCLIWPILQASQLTENFTARTLDIGKQIILFPQGTRVPLGGLVKDYPYQAGIKALYSQLNCVVVPVALNSGKYWHRDRIKKTPGTIILEFLPAIDLKTDKKDFLPLLEKVIEEKSEELLNNS